MRLSSRLRTTLMCAILEYAALMGSPMRPDEIEELLPDDQPRSRTLLKTIRRPVIMRFRSWFHGASLSSQLGTRNRNWNRNLERDRHPAPAPRTFEPMLCRMLNA